MSNTSWHAVVVLFKLVVLGCWPNSQPNKTLYTRDPLLILNHLSIRLLLDPVPHNLEEALNSSGEQGRTGSPHAKTDSRPSVHPCVLALMETRLWIVKIRGSRYAQTRRLQLLSSNQIVNVSVSPQEFLPLTDGQLSNYEILLMITIITIPIGWFSTDTSDASLPADWMYRELGGEKRNICVILTQQRVKTILCQCPIYSLASNQSNHPPRRLDKL